MCKARHVITSSLTNFIAAIDNPGALQKYYSLLSAVLKLLASTFINRGIQNNNVQSQMRQLLSDYRHNIVGMFKRYAVIGNAAAADPPEGLKDIIRSYTALLSMTDFIEVSVTSCVERLH